MDLLRVCSGLGSVLLMACLAAGCVTRSGQVAAVPTNPAEFASWDCARIDEEMDAVQFRAADVAYSVDERAGNNILALGVGVTVFWPAMLAMRPDGLEAADLARLKGRFEALSQAAQSKHCPPPQDVPTPSRAAALQIAPGERLVYEERRNPRRPASEWVLQVTALRRGENEYRLEGRQGGAWRQDRAGNVVAAPAGSLLWPHLLRTELTLGAVTAGELAVAGDPLARARLRGQVVAVGLQTVGNRKFDAAVVELFGDATGAGSNDSTRVDGAIVIDRASGVLLRLDLRSANEHFSLQRRLMRVEPPPPP